MSARWSELTSYLRGQPDQVTLSWRELDDVVGGLPESARNHPAWWSGDRPHIRAWKAAGFGVVGKAPGEWVHFARVLAMPPVADRALMITEEPPSRSEDATGPGGSDVVLVTCVKTKLPTPAAAKDLYTSDLFNKSRRYAEASGKPWFILSDEHGLVAPDEWLAPYERYLPHTSPEYRLAWGEWVAARLELLMGGIVGKVVEIHASRAYVEAALPGLVTRGAEVILPLDGLAQGERLAWYGGVNRTSGHATSAADSQPATAADGRTRKTNEDPHAWASRLSVSNNTLSPAELLETRRSTLASPGLYSWWADEVGAGDLSRGLGHPVQGGLIYAGQAGATRWPSGKRSNNTLWSRLVGMHLGKKAEFSTFRLTLGGILRESRGWQSIDEAALTAWMHKHLRVLPLVHPDADSLGDLEDKVLEIVDPPLNLQGRPSNELRSRLKQLRRLAQGW